MADTFAIKRGDTAPALRFQLTDDGAAVNLTQADEVRLLLADRDGTLVVDAVVTVDAGQGSAPAPGATTGRGWCTHTWATEDTADAHDLLRAEAQVTWSDGTVQTFPPRGYGAVIVTADLGPAAE